MADLNNTRINTTQALRLPAGNNAQRPSSANLGMMRYNTEEEIVEVYNGTEWIAIASGSSGLYDFSFAQFTPGGSTGTDGPTFSEAVSGLTGPEVDNWKNNSTYFKTANGVQIWTVPSDGNYRIEAQGGSGGTQEWALQRSAGVPQPRGARITADFDFLEGEEIRMIVGQKGLDNKFEFRNSGEGQDAGPGGGGGTFIYYNATDSTPILAAGGGAGGTRQNYSNANANFAGPDGYDSQTDPNGGTNGNGGRTNRGGPSYWAGGGAGWLTDGTGGNQTTDFNRTPGSRGAQGGQSPRRGGLGGTRWNDGTDSGGDGSFGGGGGGGSDNMGTGGGGGYSGGGGADRGSGNFGGGGGGSFIGSTNQGPGIEVNRELGSYGDGYIEITKL